jgi:hypothetical protein
MNSSCVIRAALRCALFGCALATLSPRPASAQNPATDPAAMGAMAMTGVLGIPVDRGGSGTTWIPDAVSEPMQHFTSGGWDLMLHGFVFAGYDAQGGPRGASQLSVINWGMLMASHDFAGGRLQLRSMLSLDRLGVGGSGYPELLQTGESFQGLPLHDRQHPHDLFMEVAALYDRAISKDVGLELYLAPSGEPALGPPASMHRTSSMDDPMVPIGHHWQDASHVSFGVVTAGVFTSRWKLEGSIFNGRDPDENRWDFDFNTLDSYSGRISFNPDSAWSLSASYGFIRSPEPLDAAHSMHRMVFTVQNGGRIGMDGQWATTLLWGANLHSDQPGLSNSVLAEGEAILDAKNTVFARAEFVQKPADDLALTAAPLGFAAGRSFDVGALSVGFVRELRQGRGVTLGLGAAGTVNVVPASLEGVYGSRTPLGAMLFLRVRAVGSKGAGMGSMPGMKMN